MPETDRTNDTEVAWTFAGTIKKRLADGVTVAASDYVGPGESLITETGRFADAPAAEDPSA